MTINEVAGLLGYSKEQDEKLVAEGLMLPRSGVNLKLAATSQGGELDISDQQFDAFVARFDDEEPGRWPPANVRRTLLVEAKHRCAICKDGPPLQFHHMLEWAKLKHHDTNQMLALCGTCHTRCTSGHVDYKAQVEYKAKLNEKVDGLAGGSYTYRRIADTEQRSWLSIGERVAIRALEEEFKCEVRTNVKVTAGEGWLNLHAAVVRDEDLIGIELYEYKGGGFPYFQIEHVLQIGSQFEFDRFQ